MVLGSEGRFGIISTVKVRVSALAEDEQFYGVFLPDWPRALQAIRQLVQARVPLSMLRLSNAMETQTQLALAGHPRQIAWLERYLVLRGAGEGKCLLTLGVTGNRRQATDDQFKVGTAQIIGVLAGALGNGDPETASWVAGNAQRYNDFLHIGGSWGAAASSLGADMIEQGRTPDQVSEAFRSMTRGDGYKGPGHDYVAGWVYVPGTLSVAVAPAVGIVGAAASRFLTGT